MSENKEKTKYYGFTYNLELVLLCKGQNAESLLISFGKNTRNRKINYYVS